MRMRVSNAACAALLLFASAASADPRGFAMGGTEEAVATGVDAVRWNPALLGLPFSPSVSVRLFEAGARASNNAWSLDQYNKYDGATWGDAAKSDILGSVPQDGLTFATSALGGAGVSVGPAGVYLDGVGAGLGNVSKDGLDFALNGNSLDRVYSLTGTTGQGYASAQALFGLAIPLHAGPGEAQAFGIQVGYERGIRWEQGTALSASFQASSDTASALGDFLYREGTRGSGYTVGVGYARMAEGGARMSFAIRDLLNRTTWTGTDRGYHLRGTHGLSGTENFDSLFSSSTDPAVPVQFSTRRAPVVSAGVVSPPGRTTVSALLEKGLGESPGVSSQLRAAWGVEWSAVSVLALRGGVSLGGGVGTWFSGGVGLHAGPWRLDLGVGSRGLTPSHVSGIGVSVGSSIQL